MRNCDCIEPCDRQLNVVICLIVSNKPASNRATPSEHPANCLTQIGRQIWEPWYHYVRVPCETQFPMIVGYARTSSLGQVAGLEAQERELRGAGCEAGIRPTEIAVRLGIGRASVYRVLGSDQNSDRVAA